MKTHIKIFLALLFPVPAVSAGAMAVSAVATVSTDAGASAGTLLIATIAAELSNAGKTPAPQGNLSAMEKNEMAGEVNAPAAANHEPTAVFEKLNLDYPGLEEVRALVQKKEYEQAAEALLRYYRGRTTIEHPEYNRDDRRKYAGKPLPADIREKADKGLEHLFFVRKGYGFIDYGKDIDWQYWPIKDNEIRWQLNRMYWWIPMGLAYWSTGDEKYAREWIFQYRDWVKKNPPGLSEENDRFAWRPLETSRRVQDQTTLLNIFIGSPNFTAGFLMEFLENYERHAEHVLANYSERGNHLLFEAQRMVYGGCFFPEFKNAGAWRSSGIRILNEEIGKQIYPDGLQYELSPNYHVGSINIFLKALRMSQLAGMDNEFPASYKETVNNMILALTDISFPDYVYPMFGDAKLTSREEMQSQYADWLKVFPENEVIRYMATGGKHGKAPAHLSNALKHGGFYSFRNGWDDSSTVMVLRASPPAFFHSQPDNGTFDLWVKGRNFMPDAGCYVYNGDAEIIKLREWYRQTRVHKTLTLDNRNMDICDARLIRWKTSDSLDLLTYSNPSYEKLDHRRTVLFVDKKFFVLIDEAVGDATGNIGIHFQLAEGGAVYNKKGKSVRTDFSDGNNLLIQTFGKKIKVKREEGKVSYAYRQEVPRPAFVFEKRKKNDGALRFITVLCPYQGKEAPVVTVKENAAAVPGKIDITVSIDGKERRINEDTGI